MWYSPVVTVAAAAEPVSMETARDHLNIESADAAFFDAKVARCVAAARAHAEAYCGVRFAAQTVTMKCDGFDDLAHLPVAPVGSVSSIAYIDTAGASQVLSADVYELRSEGLDAAIVLKYGQAWPSIRTGSRITVTAVVGYAAPPDDAAAAILLMAATLFREAENVAAIDMGIYDGLLCNHRRGA